MSLVTNNISGSVQNRSRIGITGSVIFADTPGSIFPSLPGNDVTFFVSGSNIERAVFGGTTVVSGTFSVSGNSILSTVIEPLLNNNNSGGVTTFSLTNQSIFYVNGASSNITANFTNAQTTNNRIISTTVILSQSATARIVSAVQIDGVASTINWANNVTPTGNSGKQDIFGFSLIRSGSAWKTLGQMTTYG